MADFIDTTKDEQSKSDIENETEHAATATENEENIIESVLEKCVSDSSAITDSTVTSIGSGIAPMYCPICTAPPEYCEYGALYDRCLPWILENYREALSPDALAKAVGKMSVGDTEDNEDVSIIHDL